MQEASRWVGRVLRDKWRIDARIARGGVGTVFAATHKNNGNHVAIKLLHPEFSRDNDTRSRFLQEGYAANQVNHPGVVRILDDDVSEEGQAFLVMELLEGELLERRRVRNGGMLPLAEVYSIADQLLDVLAAAHDKGIVHRDIKPDNLFLTNEGRLKVLDFGFAQMKSGFRQEQTATGFLLGTPGFMSPEQAVGNRAQVDAQTDVWAVGATLFTLLSGHPVHAGESAAEMLVAAANFPARSLATVAPNVPRRVIEIVDKALAFDKRDRWPNARAMQFALRNVPGRTGAGASNESGRRSGPDLSARVGDDDRTVMDKIEELDDSELVDAKPSWQTDQRTVIANAQRPLPKEAMPSVQRPFGRGEHPADLDGPTLAVDSGGDVPPPPITLPPLTPQLGAASGTVSVADGDSTVIMDSNPALARSGTGPHAVQPMAQIRGSSPNVILAQPTTPDRPFGGFPQMQAAPETQRMGDRRDGMLFVAGPALPAPPAPRGKRVLVFVGVAIVSMVIVILTGLVILAAAD